MSSVMESALTIISKPGANLELQRFTEACGSLRDALRHERPKLIVLEGQPEWGRSVLKEVFPMCNKSIGLVYRSNLRGPIRAPVIWPEGETFFSVDHVALLEGTTYCMSDDARRILINNDEDVRSQISLLRASVSIIPSTSSSIIVAVDGAVLFSEHLLNHYAHDDGRRWSRLMDEPNWVFSDLSVLTSNWSSIFDRLTAEMPTKSDHRDRKAVDLTEIQRLHGVLEVSFELGEILRSQHATLQRLERSLRHQKDDPGIKERQYLVRLVQMIDDLEYHQHTLSVIREQVNNLISLTFNVATIQQTKVLNYITMLGAVFIPLSYISSVFGMTELHANPLWYFCGAGPILFILLLAVGWKWKSTPKMSNLKKTCAAPEGTSQPTPDNQDHSAPPPYVVAGGASLTSTDAFVYSKAVQERYYSGLTVRAADNNDGMLVPDGHTRSRFDPGSKFTISPGQLDSLCFPKSLRVFCALGGLPGLERGLKTDVVAGLNPDECVPPGSVSFDTAANSGRRRGLTRRNRTETSPNALANGETPIRYRIRVFGDGRLLERSTKSIWGFLWYAYSDKLLISLTVATLIDLALSLYQMFGVPYDLMKESKVNWTTDVAVCLAIMFVVQVYALTEWHKERQLVKRNAKESERNIRATRSGKLLDLSVHDILVGDVLHFEPGDIIPADGILIKGHNVKCDESSITGESDVQRKSPGGEVYQRLLTGEHLPRGESDPFILSGSTVQEGTGTYLLTATGANSGYGRLMMGYRREQETTPLQAKVYKVATKIAYPIFIAALLLFVVLFTRFLVRLPGNRGSSLEKASTFMRILILALTLAIVAYPDGLVMVGTRALTFATMRMLKDNNLVRELRGCEAIGNATTICSSKTGILTQNKMTVVTAVVATDGELNVFSQEDIRAQRLQASLPIATRKLLVDSIALNTTALEGEEDGMGAFVGSKIDTALLNFARNFLGLESVKDERGAAEVVEVIPFERARMGIVVKLGDVYRLFVKGASEILLAQCTRRDSASSTASGDIDLTASDVEFLQNSANTYAESSFRTIVLVYKDFEQWPPAGGEIVFEEMVFLSIVGIQDPIRPGVTEAVQNCNRAGVFVRMITGDSMATAKAVASECGIYTEGGIAMEGPTFRQLSEEQMDMILPRLQVLARSGREDKRILASRLKSLGETVAVTGGGVTDGPALRTADIGFSMGIAGTEAAKEASSIVLMDDNFASIVKALLWGRGFKDAVQKFLQFHLCFNITTILLTVFSASTDPNMESVLTVSQLLWGKLVIDALAALALGSDPPTPEALNRKPTRKSAPLISINMWKMAIGQATFQTTILFTMHFRWSEGEWATMVFNTFVWMQIFNMFNSRRLDNRFNIFAGLRSSYLFIFISCIMVGGQVLIMFFGSTAFGIHPGGISGVHWAVCVLLGYLGWIWAMILRCLPDRIIETGIGLVMKLIGVLNPNNFNRRSRDIEATPV